MIFLDQKGSDAFQDSLDRQADSEFEPSFFSGSAGALFNGAANGFTQVASQAIAGGYNADEGAGALMGLLDANPVAPTPESIRENAEWAARQLRPDPNTTGMAADILFGIGDVGTRFAVGFAAGGAAGGALVAGGSVGEERYRELVGQGVDPETARNAALVRGVATGAGALLPAGVGGSLLTRVASGVGINIAAGAAGRGGEKAVLDGTKQGDAIHVFGLQDVAVDAVLGGVFGGVSRLGTDVTHDQFDAALNLKNARSHSIDSLPGAPESMSDVSRNAAAVDQAIDDILNERGVSVSAESAGVNYTPRDISPNAQIIADVFEEEGYGSVYRSMVESETEAAQIDRSRSDVAAEAPESIPAPETFREFESTSLRDVAPGDTFRASRDVGDIPAGRDFTVDSVGPDQTLNVRDQEGNPFTVNQADAGAALDTTFSVRRPEQEDAQIPMDFGSTEPASVVRERADQELKSAEQEGNAYSAAVECFLSRGN